MTQESTLDHSLGAVEAAPARRGAARLPVGIKPGAKRLVGILVRVYEAGYGFIRADDQEYFINVNSMRDRKAWKPGTRLSFMPGHERHGKATPAFDAIPVRADDGNVC
jgi:hypothetical protein